MANKKRRKTKPKGKSKPTPKKKGLLLSNKPAPKKPAKKKPAKKKARTPRKSRSHIQGWITRRRNEAERIADYQAEREAIQLERPLEERTKEELIAYAREQEKKFDEIAKHFVPTGEYIRLKDGKVSRNWCRMRLLPDGMAIHRKMKKDAKKLKIDPLGPSFHTFAKELAEQHDVTVREIYTFWYSP